MTDQPNGWLTIREAALALQVSELTIRRRIKDGKVAHRLTNGKYYVHFGAGGEPAEVPAVRPRRPSGRSAGGEGAPLTSQAVDQSVNGARLPGHGPLDLDRLLEEHTSLAAQAGRSGVLEQQLRQLEQRNAELQSGLVSLANRNGWLESRLEQHEQTIKLLGDRRHSRPWWKRLFGRTGPEA